MAGRREEPLVVIRSCLVDTSGPAACCTVLQYDVVTVVVYLPNQYARIKITEYLRNRVPTQAESYKMNSTIKCMG